jgi:peptide/nickel transport system substrate-binding protein
LNPPEKLGNRRAMPHVGAVMTISSEAERLSMGRSWYATILAFAVALLLAGGGNAGPDRLTIGMTQYPSTLNPNIDSMAAKSYVLGFTHRPFTQFDADWSLRCYLCTELPSLEAGTAEIVERDDGTQGVRTTYTIDPQARWGDGTPVTTDDVAFTLEVGKHPDTGVSNAEMYRRIVDLEIVDDKTFIFEDEKLGFQYDAINDFRLLPAHLERPVFEADPKTYRNRTLFDTDPTNPGLALGPYRIASLDSGGFIALERNPEWWGEPPAFDEIVIRTIENTAALEANLLSGEIDMVEGSLGLSLDQAIAFDARHGDRFQVFYKPGLIYEHIDFNLDNPILADLRVRQALIQGIDREALSQQLFGGRQAVAQTFVNPLDWVYTPDVLTYHEDLDEAGALLDAAGWTEWRDGIRHNPAGEALRLTLMTTSGNRSRELVQQVLQSMWQRIGVDVRIQNEPARVFFGETMRQRRFPALAMYAWISSPENVPRTTLHSQEIPSAANSWTGQNTPGFRNARMDELIDEIEITLDRDKRAPLWHELQRIYATELPVLPLYYRADPHIWPLWLEGVEPTGHLAPASLGVESWRVRDDG